MMTKTLSLLAPAIALMASPAIAQEEAAAEAEIVEDAVEAVAEAATDVVGMVAVEEAKPRYPREPRLRGWGMVKPTDYPIEAWRNNEEGSLEYSVEVDAEGKPKSCKVTKSSGSKSLDDAICPIVMARGEFRPAMAGPDQPVAGTYEGSHNWRKREPEMPQMSVVYRYTHGADGNSSNCEFLKMENIPEGMREDIERDIKNDTLCRNGPGRTRGIPYRDAEGNPVSKIVTVTFDVQLEDPVEPVE